MKFEFLAGNAALDFVNTVHNYGSDDPGDDLRTQDDFVEWSAQSGLLDSATASRVRKAPVSEDCFRRALDLRELLYAIFNRVAHDRRPGPETLHDLQLLYREAMRHSAFVPSGYHYRLEWTPGLDPLDRVVFEIVRAASVLLTSDDLRRVRQCAGEACSWLFVDSSRNGMRRWCDMKMCGNRAKVRRFRRRTT